MDVSRWLGALRGRGARERDDATVAASLNWRHAAGTAGGLPAGLELQWLGTAGFRLAYEGVTLLVDPYVTRASLGAVLGRRPLLSSAEKVERLITAADAVLVGHTHFDHAVDVPPIAARFGCPVYGSESLRRLMGLYGLAGHAVVVEPHRTYEIGPFAVTFVPSRHSKLLLGLAVPFDGELTCDHLDGLTGRAYRCGQVYGIHIAVAGMSFYHQGSADLIDSEVRHRDVDVFLAGIAGRMFTRDYLGRILRLLSPRVVVPHHYDDFFRGLDAPMGFSFNVDLAGFPDEVAAVSRSFAVSTLDPLQAVGGG